MTNKELILNMVKEQGRNNARDLRNRAAELTGTEIIDEESKIPTFDNNKDYTEWSIGAPCIYDGQVYGLLQPYNAANHPDTNPAVLPALWRVIHTTDPTKAKPYVKPTSTSDMYLAGECILYVDGLVYCCLRDTVYDPVEYAEDWAVVENVNG